VQLCLVLGEVPAQFDDEGGGLLQGERQVAKFVRKGPGGGFVAGVLAFAGHAGLKVAGGVLR
jgi:hypothetical protein